MLSKFSLKKSVVTAKNLRQLSTDAEKILWSILRDNQTGHKFRRQSPIGPYIADFCCKQKSLIIELDGGQHNEEADKQRTLFLEQQGYTILRFWNHDMLQNKAGVFETISKALQEPGPHPNPLPAGR